MTTKKTSGRARQPKRPAARKPVKKRPAARTRPGLWYINAAGKRVQDTAHRIDPNKLYHVQPDGSYLRGVDARSIGHVKPPAGKLKK